MIVLQFLINDYIELFIGQGQYSLINYNLLDTYEKYLIN
jgi:hypothetical protein